MIRVFIDGSSGTTGLRIRERLESREDVSLIVIDEEKRKDPAARKEALESADVAFLCLPDAAAAEAADMAKDADTVVIDTSTAHRTSGGWTYGFPEIGGLRDRIKTSKRIANPGCHASGFIALVAPLAEAGVIPKDATLSCFSLTGYSGGGKKMISDYDDPARAAALAAPRIYALGQTHKHLPEMTKVCGLEHAPVFSPIVSSYYSGMTVAVPLDTGIVRCTTGDIAGIYSSYYQNGLVSFALSPDEDGFLSASSMSGRDDMTVSVFGNAERMVLVARFDNLGKGASGAAIQNMNIVLGLPEKTGLVCE